MGLGIIIWKYWVLQVLLLPIAVSSIYIFLIVETEPLLMVFELMDGLRCLNLVGFEAFLTCIRYKEFRNPSYYANFFNKDKVLIVFLSFGIMTFSHISHVEKLLLIPSQVTEHRGKCALLDSQEETSCQFRIY